MSGTSLLVVNTGSLVEISYVPETREHDMFNTKLLRNSLRNIHLNVYREWERREIECVLEVGGGGGLYTIAVFGYFVNLPG